MVILYLLFSLEEDLLRYKFVAYNEKMSRSSQWNKEVGYVYKLNLLS